jgi:hypothetical protein
MPRNTTTALFDSEGNNRTATHLSTSIIITVEGRPVGAIQDISIDESRPNIAVIQEVGTDGFIDSAPNGSTAYAISCTRTRFARVRMAEAFGRAFMHVKSQRVPFDIEIHDIFHDADAANAIITVVKNCWIKKIGYSYQVSDWVVSDKMDLVAEDIYSLLNGSNAVPNTGITYINPFEQQADRGQYRGALDAPGLMNAFLID